MHVNELIDNEYPVIEKEYHCQGRCPLCGNTDYVMDDFYESSEPDGSGGRIRTVDFEKTCEGCGARYTQRFKLGDYIKTIDVRPETHRDWQVHYESI